MMTPVDRTPAWLPLRSVTRRLTTTPIAQLPYIAPSLACTLSTCGELLGTIDDHSQKRSQSEASVLVHKLRTQISTLLQDRSKEARWAAVILVKATVEAGGYSILRTSDKWIRALLGLVRRSEPSTTKILSIIVLTRIFLLTQGHQSLIRELTTPSLPVFFTSCLGLVAGIKVLWAIGKLLPHHPTACRPFIGQIRSLVLPLIAPTPSCLSIDGSRSEISGTVCSEITAQRARHVLILLSGCAAKNTQSHEWAAFLSTVIETAHRTADLVFGALLEDWEPLDQNSRYNRREPESSTGTVGSPDDQSGLPDWEGISAGLERLNGLLLTIQAHLTLATTVAVNTPVGKIVNLIDRMLSALPPSEEGSKDAGQGTRTNPEIGRNERETLWTGLPDLHVSAMQILEHLIVRLEEGAMALDYRFLEYVLWVFEHEHAHIQIRKAVYSVVALLLPRCRPGIPRTIASSLERCVRISCEDLLPVQRGSMSSNGDRDISHAGVSKDSSSADAYSKNPRASSAPSTGPSEVQRMAEHMLCLALAHLPPSFLRLPVRSKIDQTAILAQSQLMLRSSVLNAPALHMREQQSSLMPLLARQFPQDQGTEALIRPRLPPIQQSTNDGPTDSPLEAEDAERIFEEGARRSSTIHAVPRDIHLATDIESEKQEQTTPSAQLPPIDAPPREALPATDPFSEPDQRALGSTIPTKRSRELDPDGMNGTALDRLEHLLTPGAEPVSKRHREETGDMYIPPASEDVIPSSTVTAPPEDLIPRLTNLSAFSKPLADLRNINDGMDDDDSDDSSIPAIDPTLATDDEEEDDDESADELARE